MGKATVSGMMNIGFNPTVSGKEKSIEIHFFDLEKDLYHQKLQIDIVARIRDEHKFDSVDSLKVQLQKDKLTSLSMLSQ